MRAVISGQCSGRNRKRGPSAVPLGLSPVGRALEAHRCLSLVARPRNRSRRRVALCAAFLFHCCTSIGFSSSREASTYKQPASRSARPLAEGEAYLPYSGNRSRCHSEPRAGIVFPSRETGQYRCIRRSPYQRTSCEPPWMGKRDPARHCDRA